MVVKPFVELNRKDGSLILIRRSEILSIVDEPDGALLKLRNGTIQVVQQTYDQVKSEMNIDE